MGQGGIFLFNTIFGKSSHQTPHNDTIFVGWFPGAYDVFIDFELETCQKGVRVLWSL